MKAILLAGGQGTRLRPLTLDAPKPVVPIFNRPFLHYQLDLIRQVPEITEVILSLNYQPRRIEEVFGDGADLGLRLRYVVEPAPLGTAGAIKYAGRFVDESVVVFNGDVLTQIDLGSVIELHRSREASATIVLTPVENPSAYGLVETGSDGTVRRFLEKPSGDEITCNTINAGIYVLEPSTFDRIPEHTNWSIERKYFPSLVGDGEVFVAYVYDGYWIDIGTPGKYLQVHRDIMDGRFEAPPFTGWADAAVDAAARVHPEAELRPPCFVDAGAVICRGARIGPHSVIGSRVYVDQGASVDGAILWPDSWVGAGATVEGAILGRRCHLGRHAQVGAGAVLGNQSHVTDYTTIPGAAGGDRWGRAGG